MLSRRPVMLEAIQNAEHLLHDRRDKLTQPQVQEMQQRISELREYYENMVGFSLERLNALRDMMALLDSEQRDKVRG